MTAQPKDPVSVGQPLDDLRWVSDRNHGWLQVPVALFPKAGDNASSHSYYNPDNRTFYLEEDCDAGAFIRTHHIQNNLPSTHYDQPDCFVRQLPHW